MGMIQPRAVMKRHVRDKHGKPIPTGRWEQLVCLGKDPITGKKRWTSETFDSKEQCVAFAAKCLVEKNDGTLQPTLSKQSFADYLRESWLPMYRKQVRSTYTVEMVLGKWIFFTSKNKVLVPCLGSVPLRKLRVAHFTKLYAAMAEAGVQRRGVEHLHGILRRALKYAVQAEELQRNPTDKAVIPKTEIQREIVTEHDEDTASEVEYLTLDQAKRFRVAAKTERWRMKTERWTALWLLLLDAGLRPGEALALQWRHIDAPARLVKVRGTLARVRGEAREEKGQGWRVTPPKTPSSNGDVPVRQETIDALLAWKKEQAAVKREVGREWQKDYDFVFTTDLGAPLGNNLGRAWARVMREADGGVGDLGTWAPAPIRKVVRRKTKRGQRSAACSLGPAPQPMFAPRYSPYVLRHTCATLLLVGGMDLLFVSRRLRHKNITITARFYGHINAAHTTQAPEIWDRLFGS